MNDELEHRQNIRFSDANVAYVNRIKKDSEKFSHAVRRIIEEHESNSKNERNEIARRGSDEPIKIVLGKLNPLMDHVAALLDIMKMTLSGIDGIDQRLRKVEAETNAIRAVTDMVKQQAGRS